MKKLLILLLALLLCFALFACTSDEPTDVESEPHEPNEPTAEVELPEEFTLLVGDQYEYIFDTPEELIHASDVVIAATVTNIVSNWGDFLDRSAYEDGSIPPPAWGYFADYTLEINRIYSGLEYINSNEITVRLFINTYEPSPAGEVILTADASEPFLLGNQYLLAMRVAEYQGEVHFAPCWQPQGRINLTEERTVGLQHINFDGSIDVHTNFGAPVFTASEILALFE